MKPERTGTPPTEEQILHALRTVGLAPSSDQCRLLAEHAKLVLEANAVTNLTRITAQEEFLRLHIVDSLYPMLHLDLAAGRVIDVGSGAGFPGIPLAIMGCDVTLCESRGKKAELLSQWVERLGLAAGVVRSRAEEISAASADFDWVVMRAVSSLGSLVELASPLLRQKGVLVAMKGPRSAVEETAADATARQVGMRRLDHIEYSLPDGGELRTTYTYERAGVPKIKLPRRPGLAQTQPLG